MTEEPRDPFYEEEGPPERYALRKGEMVFLPLAELNTIDDVIEALKTMPESDLKCIVLERLYMWHATKDGPPALPPDEWLRWSPQASGPSTASSSSRTRLTT